MLDVRRYIKGFTTGVKTYDYCQPNIKLVFQISKIREQLKLKVDTYIQFDFNNRK